MKKKLEKSGRPPTVVDWPTTDFTVQQIMSETHLSRVTLYSKIKEARKDKTIALVGKIKGSGRPADLFRRIKAAPAPVVVDTVAAPEAGASVQAVLAQEPTTENPTV